MEEATWEQRLQALTHILTTPTTTPSLHSQYFISTQLPSYHNWDYYPPLFNPNPISTKWAFSLFLKRAFNLGPAQQVSWRSKCPYQQPPPLVLAQGVEEAKWDDQGKRMYVRKRLKRKRIESNVNPLIPFLVPNVFLLSMLLWDPFPENGA